MKKLLMLALFLPLCAFQTPAFDDVTDQNRMLFKALLEEDASVIDNIADGEFTLVAFDGNTFDKETVLTGLKGGYGTFDVAEAESTNVKTVGDISIVTGTAKAKGQIQGTNFDLRAFYNVTYIRRGAVWKAYLMQFTPIKQ